MVRVQVQGPTRPASLRLPEGDHITVAVQRSGTYYERELLDAIRTRGATGTYVDVGAHYGNHSVFFGMECGADRLVSIEPNPETFAGLVANLAENGLDDRATPLRTAIHPTWTRVEIEIPPWEPGPENPALTNTGMARVSEAAEGATPAVPLDEALRPFGPAAAIKVDVEGGALGVVESGRATIERDRPLLVVEALSDAEQARLESFLVPLGYEADGPYSWTPTWIWAPSAASR